jgi:hypothetical protein
MPPRNSARLAVCAALLALGERAEAQLKLYTRHGDDSFDELGEAVSGAGDVNADGVPDFIAGAPRDETMGSSAGLAKVYSGLDGKVLYVFHGWSTNDEFGMAVGAAGDVNADGYGDVIVGSHYLDALDVTGNAQVFSGFDGSLLHTLAGTVDVSFFAPAVDGAGDMDGDGHDDVIVGEAMISATAPGSGRVRVYSGFDGSVLHELTGGTGERMGRAVDGAGDVDGDGTPDFVVGGDDVVPPARVWVFSGADGSLLHDFAGNPAGGDGFGESVSRAGDVDGDGHGDVIVGAPSDDTAGSAAGAAYVHSGADGSVLHSFFGNAAGDQLGIDVNEGGDFDGDGRADVLVGMVEGPGTFGGTACMQLYSGSDGSLMRQLESGVPNDEFGRAVAALGDIDGDGVTDFIGGAPSGDVKGTSAGSLHVFSAVIQASNYCISTPNSTGSAATITYAGYPSVWEDDLVLIAEHLPPNKSGLFLRGTSPDQQPFYQGFLCIAPPVKRIFPMLTASAAGVASTEFSVNNSSGVPIVFAGETWYFQYLYRDGGHNNLTDGLQITFIP